jgi:hypothetical protein
MLRRTFISFLDIKPYIKDLDSKSDANYGWLDDLDNNKEHLLLHIKGTPHDRTF